MTCLSLLFTMSLTAYLWGGILLSIYLLHVRVVIYDNRLAIFYKWKSIILVLVIFLSVVTIGHRYKVLELPFHRIQQAFKMKDIAQKLMTAYVETPSHLQQHYNVNSVYRQYSAYISTFGELAFTLKALRERPIFGFGIGYDKKQLKRTMGFWAHTEFLIRWGIIGLSLFFLCCYYYPNSNKMQRKLLFATLFVPFLSSNGSIAEPFFWLLLAIILVYRNHYMLAPRKSLLKMQEAQ